MYTLPQTIPEMLKRNVVDFPNRDAAVALGTGRVLEDMKNFRDKEVFDTTY